MRIITETLFLQPDNYGPEDDRVFVEDVDEPVVVTIPAAKFNELGKPDQIVNSISLPSEVRKGSDS